MSKPSFSASDLATKAGKLNSGGAAPSTTGLGSADQATVDAFAAIYTKHKGDIGKIFGELGEDASKAKKHPPADAAEFGRKYAEGYYTSA